jgi:hypothetical protein
MGLYGEVQHGKDNPEVQVCSIRHAPMSLHTAHLQIPAPLLLRLALLPLQVLVVQLVVLAPVQPA